VASCGVIGRVSLDWDKGFVSKMAVVSSATAISLKVYLGLGLSSHTSLRSLALPNQVQTIRSYYWRANVR
jgi:hypothetical protein